MKNHTQKTQKKRSKKMAKCLLAAVLAAGLLAGGVSPAAAIPGREVIQAEAATKKVKGKYYQKDARKMKSKVNAFRTGDDAWYWNENNSKKVRVKGLKKLSYDYTLEKIAMRRAAEIVLSFSHTRPNGKDCFSLYPDGVYRAMGENIAMGTSSIMTMNDAFTAWQETDEDYEGQGHRRNMLSESFTSIGIACIEVNGEKYWVQEFGSPNSGAKKTDAVNKTKTVKVDLG